jgi:hypothetical protein
VGEAVACSYGAQNETYIEDERPKKNEVV